MSRSYQEDEGSRFSSPLWFFLAIWVIWAALIFLLAVIHEAYVWLTS